MIEKRWQKVKYFKIPAFFESNGYTDLCEDNNKKRAENNIQFQNH